MPSRRVTRRDIWIILGILAVVLLYQIHVLISVVVRIYSESGLLITCISLAIAVPLCSYVGYWLYNTGLKILEEVRHGKIPEDNV